MTRPKGKLFALLAIFVAIGIVTATGAFTSVQAERTVKATVDNDANAILGLSQHSSNNGQTYASINNGVLELDLGAGGSVNYNATTDYDYVFNITNQGSQSFDYYITRNGEAAGADNVVVFKQGTASGGTNVTGDVSNAQTLTTSETDQISVQIDLQGIDSSDVSTGTSLLDSITIHADA